MQNVHMKGHLKDGRTFSINIFDMDCFIHADPHAEVAVYFDDELALIEKRLLMGLRVVSVIP